MSASNKSTDLKAKRYLIVALATTACVGAAAAFHLFGKPSPHDGHHMMASLKQTLLAVDGGQPLRLPALIGADGSPFTPERLQGRWSLVFFGFTSCPHVCPTTLQVLSAVARDPASGVAAGTSQILFVSVDPERDTPQRMKAYVESFGGRMTGLTGSRQAIDDYSAAVNAGYRSSGSGIDHSTSLFVIDPKGRLAGVLLRPDAAASIVADLKTLQSSYAGSPHVSLVR